MLLIEMLVFQYFFIGETAIDLGEEALSDEKFKEMFKNRKTSESVEIYKKFYEACLEFKNDPKKDKLEELKGISNEQSIKRAFGFGKTPFEFGVCDVEEFLSNQSNTLFTAPSFNKAFYNTFRESKRHDLQKEYQDILIRTFKLSGLISFENALVNLSSRELASFVFKDLEIVGI